jgi:adenylate cyclase class 2
MKSTVKEIEVKAKVKDFKKILIELNKLSCKLSEPIDQEDSIYLPDGVNFTEIGMDTNVLRIRKQNDKSLLTLKRNGSGPLVKIEKETVIENSNQMEEILEYLGYYQVMKVKKQRIKCNYNGMEICLDNVEGLGTYIELEKITSDEPLKVQEDLLSVLESLGVDINDRVFYGYDILIYFKQHPEQQNTF